MTEGETILNKIVKSEAEWREQLSQLAYEVTRNHATERPFTHDDFPEVAGTYYCVCCGAALFKADDKFNAGCGWPSFTQPLDGAGVGESVDRSHFMVRTEVHCDQCDAHLGHVFPDGPPPTGLRYCINGVALRFEEAD
ncbi:peptide-methionine (R)-S-oxide reductase MsrB [Ketogulonicigenium vulgare]|uniref:peptide-methionine (R)-S-oxide reductase n=1 Tax=Ketogulonicigenium vulgare (strain WSH-001) TaxID=759362 RepID=F9Y5G5_KETVW|nr:peptide-methionine (R)-S-oxide reductase MsrB [Ketogulonicigenium vulgare]AEM40718.1 Peptide methionine sulfoxide reductase MsrB 3 [Ketogulonicigenium vulgare WSH-001]ALJ80888.1 methionine sulfoxide reductase B [Ketogulonicigenium vulgare]ANW33660.1 peptide-methionine (R)-S-oxide reductase [Ketogulonicigenium vulgare]